MGYGGLRRSVVLRLEQAVGTQFLDRQLGLELRVEFVEQSLVQPVGAVV